MACFILSAFWFIEHKILFSVRTSAENLRRSREISQANRWHQQHQKDTRIKFITCCIVLILSIAVNAQTSQRYNFKTKPIKTISWGCATTKAYPKKQLRKLVRSTLRSFKELTAIVWGDRAYKYDLNGDGQSECFVPLDCGATGNCNWGIFELNPARLLGVIGGEFIYIHKPVSEYSSITVYIHGSASSGLIERYIYRQGKYIEYGKDLYVSVEADNFPKYLEGCVPLCDPEYRTENSQKRDNKQK